MNRIKELRNGIGMSQSKLSKMLKIAQNTLSYWENGRYEPDFESLSKIADIFHVSVDYLLGKTNNPIAPNEKPRYFSPDEEKLIDLYQGASQKAQQIAVSVLELGQIKKAMQKHDCECCTTLVPDIDAPIYVPILGKAAAGTPIEMIEDFDNPLKINDPKIHPGDFAVIAEGNSMIDVGINEGDRVIIRPCPEVDNGTIALIAIGDGSTIKRFYKTENGFRLVPANNTMEPILYGKDKNLRVLGKFIKVINI